MANPIEQFKVTPIIPIEVGGVDISFTNSALFMVVASVLIISFLTLSVRSRALVPGRWQSVADICSQPLTAFELDRQIYFIVGSYCCDCGWVEKQLYRYDGRRAVEKLYSSRDFPKM